MFCFKQVNTATLLDMEKKELEQQALVLQEVVGFETGTGFAKIALND